MNRSVMWPALVLAVAVVVTSAPNVAVAALTKMVSYMLDASDPNAEKSCTDRGGVVSTKAGVKACTLAATACTASTNPANPYTLDPNDPNAAKACTDACGTISTDAGGQKICTKPSLAAPAPTPMREPPNQN